MSDTGPAGIPIGTSGLRAMMRRLARPYRDRRVGWSRWSRPSARSRSASSIRPRSSPASFGFGPTALVGMELLGVTFASVGALLVVRRPGNAVGWCMVLIGDGYALGGLSAAITGSAVADGPAGAATAGLAGWFTVFFTTIGGLVFGLGFIFPTGRGHTPGLGPVRPARCDLRSPSRPSSSS